METKLEKFKKINDKDLNWNPAALTYDALIEFRVKGNISQSKRQLEKALKNNPNFVQAYITLADILYIEGKTSEAIKILKQGIKMNPSDPTLRGRFGLLLEKSEKLMWAKIQLALAEKFEQDVKQSEIWRKILERVERKIRNQPQSDTFSVWTMARKDCYRSSFIPLGELQGKINITQQDYFSFDSPVNPVFLPNIPSLVVAGDMIVFPDVSMKTFRGVKISNINEVVWKPGMLADRLTYSSTPVYMSPYLFFSLGNSIRRVDLSKPNPSIESLVADPKLQMSPYCAPTAYENIVIFAFRECVYCYDLDEDKGNFISLDIIDQEDILRSPVICDGELIILSQSGRIFIIDILTGCLIKADTLPIKGIYSAPCVMGNNIYFEIFDEELNSRKVGAYCPKDGSIVTEELTDELCSPEDMHLNFSPLVFGDTVLVASDVSPVFYKVRRTGSLLENIPLELDIQVGHQRVTSVFHVFSVVVGSYLISKSMQGFFYVNLDDPSSNRIENMNSEMVTQPIVNGERVFFLCKDGIECFLLQRELQRKES